MKNKNNVSYMKNALNKQNPANKLLKVLLAVLTLIYPLFMVIMTGAGLIYNSASYGKSLTLTGVLLIVSGLIMTVGSILCILNKNISAIISSSSGFFLCMLMLYRLVIHADSAGWRNKFTLESISSMYINRIMPVTAVLIITVTVAVIQLLSYQRKNKGK